MKSVLLFSMLLSWMLPAWGTTYYISSSGDDKNSGVTKSAPWAHAPGMPSCRSVCAESDLRPGDSLIFRGGDTWGNDNYPWLWRWSGSDSGHIYIGVDKSWFLGASWARPILNGNGRLVSGNNNFIQFYHANPSISNVVIDNIEFTGLYWSYSEYGHNIYVNIDTGINIGLTNLYFHGWSHAPCDWNGSRCAVQDSARCVQGATYGTFNVGSYIANSLFDGFDTDRASMMAVYAGPATIFSSVVRNMSNGLVVGRNANIHDNVVGPINDSYDPAQHENCIEPLGAGFNYVYNNIWHDCTGVALLMGSLPSAEDEYDYVWNNVAYSSARQPIPIAFDSQNNVNGNHVEVHAWNNTVFSPRVCIRTVKRNTGKYSVLDIVNNHCITQDAKSWSNLQVAGEMTAVNNNTIQEEADAVAQGYTGLQTYRWSPTSARGATVGTGQDLSPNCGRSGLSALCRDTTYACSISTDNTILCPQRRPVSRGTSWDTGAYQFRRMYETPRGLRVVPR